MSKQSNRAHTTFKNYDWNMTIKLFIRLTRTSSILFFFINDHDAMNDRNNWFFFFFAHAECESCVMQKQSIIKYRNNVDRNHKSLEHAFIDNDSRIDDDRTSDHAIISYSITKRYYYSSSFFVFDVVRRREWHFDCVSSIIIAIDSSNFQKITTSNYSFFGRWKCAKSKLRQTKIISKNDLFVIQTFFRIKNFSNEMFYKRINCFICKKNADNHMQKNCDQNSCSIKNEIVFDQNVDLKQKNRCDNRSKKTYKFRIVC